MDNVIRNAIEVIAEKGWIKGDLERQNGYISQSSDTPEEWTRPGVCMIGALRFGAKIDRSEDLPIYIMNIVQNVIDDQLFDRGHNIPFFNDHEDTVVEDVIMVLEKAAVRLDEVV